MVDGEYFGDGVIVQIWEQMLHYNEHSSGLYGLVTSV